MAKLLDDKVTAELPGLVKRGRPAKHGVPMTAAERQRAYREAKERRVTDAVSGPSKAGRVELLELLSWAMQEVDGGPKSKRTAERTMRELITRYELTI